MNVLKIFDFNLINLYKKFGLNKKSVNIENFIIFD